jgi:NAD(P)-dependent dehydrogenase (short-subunit alcohol dehydrogenase family)
MSRIFITGSADGLGQMAAQRLAAQGHSVVLHGRDAERAGQALAAVPGAQAAVYGDLSDIGQTCRLADQVNQLGPFDAVIHNAGVGYREPRRIETAHGLSHVFAINTLAPYILSALIAKPQRLVYLSSGMHEQGAPSLADLQWSARRWEGARAYADSKLHDVLLAFGIARRWPQVRCNAVHPGWVPTRMGGPGAPDDMGAAPLTQAWLAVSDDPAAQVTGAYFYHMKQHACARAARDTALQDSLLAHCAQLSGVALPQ